MRTKKDTNEVYEDWEEVGYFSSVENALFELVRQQVRDSELKDLKSVVAEIKKLEEMIRASTKTPTSPVEGQ